MEEADLLSKFQFARILSEDSRAKCVYLLGRIPNQDQPEMEDAILYFEKHHFYESELPILASNRITELIDTESNDIYHWTKTNLVKDSTRPEVNIRIIYPATQAHIDKYSSRPFINIRETKDDYLQITKPYIEEQPLKRVQWVYNILEGKAEAERVLMQDQDPDTGFILLPDMKWDMKTMNALYLVVLVQRRDLKSIRDLNASHLPLLRNIAEKVGQFVHKTYGVKSQSLRMFFHYQPSYYHLHVHVVHTTYTSAPGIIAGQAHLLDQVIDNIAIIDNDYYQRATIPFVLADNHELSKRYIAAKGY